MSGLAKGGLKIKILLVDDRENNLLSMESILENENYTLVKATSGTEALKILLKDWEFTLILMDVEMPILNGFETATMIYQREKLRHIPIIFITAHSYGDDNIYKGYKAGAVDYIYKPIQADLLRVKVSVFVELYKKNHQLLQQEQKLKAINKNLEIEIRDRITSEEKVKELNKQLLKNIETLESANAELDQFAFIASHDLQEPLRKIRMFNDFILLKYKDKLDEEGQRHLTRMQVAVERMQNLIKDILMFSKIGTTHSKPILSDLGEILNEVIINMEMAIQSKQAKITVGKLPKMFVNPSLVKILFQQMIGNSLKFSPAGKQPEITISAHCEPSAEDSDKIKINKYWRICVADNGVGFEQKYADQIFTMFKRLHTTADYSGTGIGLAICKKIVDEHNGYISVKSSPNKGSTFTISLPMDPSAVPSNEKAYTIYYEPDLKSVVMEWKGNATSEQFREGTELMLNSLIKYKTSKVLADIREMVLIGTEDQQWLNSFFLPRAQKFGFKSIAIVKPENYFNQVAIENVSNKIKGEGFSLKVFDDKQEAGEWLSTQQNYDLV